MNKENMKSEKPQMINSESKYHRSELAKHQLRTAVLLFLNEKDLSSVILEKAKKKIVIKSKETEEISYQRFQLAAS